MRGIISVFGSALPEEGSEAYAEAREVGRLLAREGFEVMTGGYGGVMEAASRGAMEAGGRSIGVTVSSFDRKPNAYLSEEIRTNSLFERLEILLSRPTGYIALSGGSGTLAEVALAWELGNKSWMRTQQQKPLVLLGQWWIPLMKMIYPDNALAAPQVRQFVFHHTTAPEAVGQVVEFLERQ